MNQKELREIRKRFTLDKDSISHVYGCYVNAAKDIVARMDMSMGLMEQEEAELYLKLLKKSISGSGKEPAGYRVFHETGGGQR